ncbi:protein argonaute-2-like [Paramacrobiotus metropolitanus]|uniref:protein argonaute-2-like n=1 Tax=Paramacrobiotus metropolitanus TaxID=2943436 RepID=UPI002445F33C|nr:protein argonaute-2-like [Paramacrobiotus metropolitanus]
MATSEKGGGDAGGQKLVGVKRHPTRGFGTLGTPIALSANHYMVKIPTSGYFYHYDVDMVFERGTPAPAAGDQKGKGKKQGTRDPNAVPRALKQKIMALFLGAPNTQKILNGCRPAYDGEKNLYTIRELKIAPDQDFSEVLTVPKDEEGGERRVKVTLKPCKPLAIAWAELSECMAGRRDAVPIVVFQCINTVFRQAALSTATNIAIRRSYFSRNLAPPVELGQGRFMWTGYYSSARPTQWKVLLNLDKSHTVFYGRQKLLEFVSQFLNSSPASLNVSQRKTLEKELKGLKVETNHGGGIRRVRITGITDQTPDNLFFEQNGQKKSVTNYFKTEYNLDLRQRGLPCLKVGTKGSLLPLEVCTLIEQKCDKRLTSEQTADMVRKCTQTANERKRFVENTRRNGVSYDSDPTLKEFGISVDKEMVKVEGRQLDAPTLAVGDKKTVMVKKSDGTYDSRSIKFAVPGTLKNWAIISLVDENRIGVRPFVESLVMMGKQKGMTIDYPNQDTLPKKFDWRNPDFVQIMKEIVKNFGTNKVDLIMVLISQDFHYAEVKKAGDVIVGVPTQCVKGYTIQKNVGPKLGQLVGNLLLKINTKVGGINVQVANFISVKDQPVPKFFEHLKRFVAQPTIVFGADVTHPSPGESKDKPSVAAVVASHNKTFTAYSARVGAQGHRVEVMEDCLRDMIAELLIEFRVRNNNHKPQKIIFYRDGVSEGQFEQVMLQEVHALQAACRKLEPGYQPHITYIIVGKRHHTRMFCQNKRDEVGRGENIPAGTVVDKGICHFSELDYFLCSHGGLQGTSRPGHYNMLYDDSDFSADEIELFSYYLTYCYARCSRSVSIPAPAYYAHHVAFRARHHLSDDGIEAISTVSLGSGSDPSIDIQQLNKKIKVHDNIMNPKEKSNMYFV